MKHCLKWLGALVGAAAYLALAPEAEANSQRSCLVDNVAVVDTRMHIKCAPNPSQAYTSAIPYYALPLSEPAAKIESLIALAIAAKRERKAMVLWFDMNDYKSVPGCQGHNCRRLRGAALE